MDKLMFYSNFWSFLTLVGAAWQVFDLVVGVNHPLFAALIAIVFVMESFFFAAKEPPSLTSP